MKQILNFLGDLEKNNNRDWFHENKQQYQQARKEFLNLVQNIINNLQLYDPRLTGLDAADTVFRIFRDIRFSKNKTPYKTNFGAYMARGGRKSKQAAYYLHISNQESFIAAGMYSPQKEELNAVRQELLYQPSKFRAILQEKTGKGYYVYEKDMLKTGPAGFPKDSPEIDLLKYKHFLLMYDFNRSDLLKENFSQKVVKHYIELLPFTEYLNTALEFKGNE